MNLMQHYNAIAARIDAREDMKRLEQIKAQLESSTDPEELRRFALQGVAREIKIVRRVITTGASQ